MKWLIGVLFLGFAGCSSDTDLYAEPPGPGVSNPPEEVNTRTTDRFVQIQEPKVDVLFVVDNSSSMGPSQQLLARNFPLFLGYFLESGLDYHIGMTTTDVELDQYRGKLRRANGYRYIDRDTLEPSAVFGRMTSGLGTIGGSAESGRAAAYMAVELLKDDPRNVGFIRPEAELHMIFVSDTFDNSTTNPVSMSEFMNWARDLKSPSDRTTMHAIVQLPNDPACAGFVRPGVQYITYATASGGIVYSICEEDWVPAIDLLGLQTTGLKQEFFLTRLPVTQPELLLEVRVRYPGENGQDVTLQFEVCMAGEEVDTPSCQVVYSPRRNSITFLEYVADPLAEVLIEYTRSEDFAADAQD